MWSAGRTGRFRARRNTWRRSDEPKRSGSGVSIRCSIVERGGMMRICDWNTLKREHPTFGVPASTGSVSRDTLKRGHQTDLNSAPQFGVPASAGSKVRSTLKRGHRTNRVSLTAREKTRPDVSSHLDEMLKELGY